MTKTGLFLVLILFLFNQLTFSAISPQLINLNLEFKGKKDQIKSDLTVPFYQKAELEKSLDHKLHSIEIHPKKTLDPKVVELEIRYQLGKGSKPLKKKLEVKLNESTKISLKGMTLKVTPTI